MRQELHFGGTYGPNAVKNYTIGRGHLNGLLFTMDNESAEHRLTIKRRVGKNVHLLVPNVRMIDLRRVSSIEYGYDFAGDGIIASLRELLTTDPDGAGAGAAYCTGARFDALVGNIFGGVAGGVMVYVPLGSIYNGSESELDITFTADAATPAGGHQVSMYGISRERVPDFMLQTDYSLQLEETHRSVDALYLVTKKATGNDGAFLNNLGRTPDLTVQLTDDDTSTLTNYSGLSAATNIFGAVESHINSSILVLYRRRDALPAEVFAKVSGTDSALVNLLVRRIIVDQGATSANTYEELKSLRERVQLMETRHPDVAKALRHAGEIAKSSDLAAVEAAVAQSNAADAVRR